jgi:hypothetical protein
VFSIAMGCWSGSAVLAEGVSSGLVVWSLVPTAATPLSVTT